MSLKQCSPFWTWHSSVTRLLNACFLAPGIDIGGGPGRVEPNEGAFSISRGSVVVRIWSGFWIWRAWHVTCGDRGAGLLGRMTLTLIKWRGLWLVSGHNSFRVWCIGEPPTEPWLARLPLVWNHSLTVNFTALHTSLHFHPKHHKFLTEITENVKTLTCILLDDQFSKFRGCATSLCVVHAWTRLAWEGGKEMNEVLPVDKSKNFDLYVICAYYFIRAVS